MKDSYNPDENSDHRDYHASGYDHMTAAEKRAEDELIAGHMARGWANEDRRYGGPVVEYPMTVAGVCRECYGMGYFSSADGITDCWTCHGSGYRASVRPVDASAAVLDAVARLTE